MDIVAQLVAWFTDTAQWSGSEAIPVRVWEHVWYSFVAVAAATAIALPVGVGLGHWGRGGVIAINISNAGRAVPAFGLLVLMMVVAGFGYLPIFVALTALAIPPMVTNSYAAMRAVDAEVKDAAIGMGMTRWQRLWQAEVPVALPLILAGIRTSTLQVIATATLAAVGSQGGLGRYIVDGLANDHLDEVLGGAILVAALALTTEFLMSLVQTTLVSRGLAQRSAGEASRAKTQKTA